MREDSAFSLQFHIYNSSLQSSYKARKDYHASVNDGLWGVLQWDDY